MERSQSRHGAVSVIVEGNGELTRGEIGITTTVPIISARTVPVVAIEIVLNGGVRSSEVSQHDFVLIRWSSMYIGKPAAALASCLFAIVDALVLRNMRLADGSQPRTRSWMMIAEDRFSDVRTCART